MIKYNSQMMKSNQTEYLYDPFKWWIDMDLLARRRNELSHYLWWPTAICSLSSHLNILTILVIAQMMTTMMRPRVVVLRCFSLQFLSVFQKNGHRHQEQQ